MNERAYRKRRRFAFALLAMAALSLVAVPVMESVLAGANVRPAVITGLCFTFIFAASGTIVGLSSLIEDVRR